MARAVRFLHTADWQLGLAAGHVPGDAGAIVRRERMQTIRRIGEVAHTTKAEFIIVAGDVFEHHALRPATVRSFFEAVEPIAAQIYLLPGNHDPLSSDAIYLSELWKRECPSHVHVLRSREPVIAREGVALLPCPLLERSTLGDSTAHLTPDFGPEGCVRIGVAHGGIKEILEPMNVGKLVHNTISRDRAARARLDYLALGDWHGLLRVDDRAWYPGTPEATRFEEKEPGNVLLVEIDGPSAAPRVTPHRVSGLVWKTAAFTLHGDADITLVDRFLDGLDRGDTTLLKLVLTGKIDVSMRARLDGILEKARDRFLHVRVRDEELRTALAETDAASLPTDGWIGQAVARLCADIEGTSEAERATALRLFKSLYGTAP